MPQAARSVPGSPVFTVAAHRLLADGRPVPFRPSPHGGSPIRPAYLVLHYTAGLTAASAIGWFLDPKAKASAHLVIGRDGAVTQMMAFDRSAWHAGVSAWAGLSGLNSHSIGIEMVNAGKLVRGPAGGWRTWTGEPVPEADVLIARHRNEPAEAAWHRYSEAQVATVTAIGAALHAAYRFKGVVGHEDIAPRRKVDPGPAFPLKEVAARIMGEG
ncbi:N-acetylmuramoyl-L-alanine amidase [Phreatobacter oligotrophus]|jgi:N-acetylmuramoyl-L-alanine amidase|uniref:N-acetylmuramoyl-L-alanine amidase n=1 Tax=Phreatobacter oligotrophus TaxID=1122261 RepID=UPI0023544242|nr:N-acetylmuramoyl-L-alanine amidase [Phreatobacter oligotrophus]MBX9991309.1 N-acetylmuramoyl-L-alanine amidase [Phreatobacter oligotrophus]